MTSVKTPASDSGCWLQDSPTPNTPSAKWPEFPRVLPAPGSSPCGSLAPSPHYSRGQHHLSPGITQSPAESSSSHFCTVPLLRDASSSGSPSSGLFPPQGCSLLRAVPSSGLPLFRSHTPAHGVGWRRISRKDSAWSLQNPSCPILCSNPPYKGTTGLLASLKKWPGQVQRPTVATGNTSSPPICCLRPHPSTLCA